MKGGQRRLSPFTVPMLMANAGAGAIAMRFGIRGPNFAVSSACATGAHAIGEAARHIQSGYADVMVAGSSEAPICPLGMIGFSRMGALSKRNDDPQKASRPFSKDRDGFVVAEGGATLILESREHAEERGAKILAEVAGYGASADAYHITAPDPEGKGALLAMRAALKDAGVGTDDVSYINAHGTSTEHNDRVETYAIKELFGVEAKRIPVSSCKSQLGHLLGGSGSVEAAITVMAIEHGIVPGTINLDEPDPDCDLDYVAEGPRETDVAVALSNSFGFGGQNGCLVLSKPA
jgi:3-oxoacyl-[acyl-carrier-protein] synthase II